MKLMRLHKAWRGWLSASFANQITLFAMSFTLVISLLIGAGSYIALRAQIEAAIKDDLMAQASLVESALSHFIIQAHDELEVLSRNSFVANGLLDSHGRDDYLRPFLRDFRFSIPGKEGIQLILHDFGGRPLIEVRQDKDKDKDKDANMVGQAIATGKPQVRVSTQGNETALKLVRPIYFQPTQSVEGALAARIQIAPLLANTGVALAEDQLLQLHAAGAVVAQLGASQQDVLRVERALKLAAPLDTLRLRLTLDSSTRNLYGSLDRLTLIYGVGLLLLLPLVGWFAHRSSRRLVAPLAQLGATADAIARSGAITMPLQIGAPNEVGRLADAFGRMLARLDVTQARLSNIVNMAADAIITVDEKQRILIFNYGAEQIFGYTAAEMLGQALDRLLPERYVGAHRGHIRQFGTKAQTARDMNRRQELFGRRKDGSEFFAEASISWVMEDGKQVFTVFLRDISLRKQAEDEIRQLNADLEQRVHDRTAELTATNHELESFSYSVSHDLRAPLRSIDGFSQALLEDYADKLDDQARDYLNRVRTATQFMGELIDDLLTLSRITRATMLRKTVDLSAIAGDVLAELQQTQPERRVEYRVQPDLVAEGDARLLRVVLDNLLSNAWKFTGKTASAKIEFGAYRSAEGAPGFFVRDNGAGYDMTYADKLFGAFQRLHCVSDFPGIGIGLATVKRIVHRHGGRVWAEGAVGKGATFYFTLDG